MSRIAIIGAGVTGVTTAYALQDLGHTVTVFDRHRYPAMETSFANGGQLSACNAEVWTSWATMLKGVRWMFRREAPLLFNPAPSWHKYSWLAEFASNVFNYRRNTIETTRLAIEARRHLCEIAEREAISFDYATKGILHLYRERNAFESGLKVNELLRAGGLDRFPVTPEEIRALDPALSGDYFAGLYTPSDTTGDIHKFTRGLAKACMRRGASFVQDADVERIKPVGSEFEIEWRSAPLSPDATEAPTTANFDQVVICAGVASRRLAAMLGDRINIYPVKGYSITVPLTSATARRAAPQVSLLDDSAKIATSRLGEDRFRIAGTAEFNGFNRDIRVDRVRPLVDWVRANFPDVDTSLAEPWAGLRPMTPSMMPFVGPGRRAGVFYNTGHGHLGWTLAGATARTVADLIGPHSLPLAAAA